MRKEGKSGILLVPLHPRFVKIMIDLAWENEKMESIAIMRPDDIQIVDIPRPEPGPYQALIRTEAVCLCNSTDRKLIEGHFPGVEEYPLLLGHETAGIVEKVGDKVRSFQPGDRVIGGLLLTSTDPRFHSAWGGFSQYVLAGDYKAMMEDHAAGPEHGFAEVYEIMRKVPKTVGVEDAVLLCTWREVYSAFEDFHLQPGEDIVVYGAGPVGLSFVKFARLRGLSKIVSVDKLPEKRQKALEMGADAAFPPDTGELQAYLKQRGKDLDAVIDAVGSEDIINAALPMIRLGGSICVYGVIAKDVLTVQKHLGPYNFNLFMHQWPTRARESAAQEPLIQWIEQGRLSYKEFLSAEYPVREFAKGYRQSKTGVPVKTLYRFEEVRGQ